ncbi:aminodeoxychorismate lyase [Photobacterium sanctipauli]|uniref:Aminodeoxychorismate lyase n=1 Tax=Photobacterium sanctipauli TaxID=1342794 RepID=A0A2T3NN97_9GAMM|nr:aminodeoxychorismate lyase [Photobacterium sanctipauli]PSW16962.1 aminodeoxychorismate lyase [Photobacterium sanctipauli]
MILINGKPQSHVEVTDRALQYGDGCFTTMLVETGRVRLWPLHLARLKKTVNAFAIAEPDWQQLESDVARLAAQYPEKGGVKVLISRGSGGRGYSPHGCDATQVVVSDFTWPAHYANWQQDGISLGICQQRLSISPILAGYKHLNRLEQVMLKQEAEKAGVVDAVTLDANGAVAETVASNIFWRKGNTIYTPLLDLSGVHGVMRRHVIEIVASLDYCLESVKMPLDSLLCADEVFITNALMALVPVNDINGIKFVERDALNAINKRLYTC